MKAKYSVAWWCDKSDSAKTRGFPTYVEALEFQQATMAKTGRRNVRIIPK